jgi:hypothetical protein
MTDLNFQQTPAVEVKMQPAFTFFCRCFLLLTDRKHICIFCGVVATLKIMNFEEYRYCNIAKKGTGRIFVTVPVNCTQYVADCKQNYTVYIE